MIYSQAEIWFIILGVATGTYILRFSFLGLIGDRPLPEWVERHLRYVAVAVLPAIAAPLVLWPEATGGEIDLPRIFAALVACAIGVWRRSVVLSVFTGLLTLYVLLWFQL
jgi:branched-subunit amino acid transport protein